MPRYDQIMSYDLFIAHAGPDTPIAEELYDELTKLRVSCFLDSRSLRLGDDWDLSLRSGQEASRATVVLVSPNCDQAFYQREEIAAAIAMARADPDSHRVIPLYISEPEVLSVPYGLRIKHGMYLTREATLETAAKRLAEAVRIDAAVQMLPAEITYDIDLCMCIDVSNSLNWLVKLMRRQLVSLGFDLANEMAEAHKPVGRLRVRVITFGPAYLPIDATPMIELPAGAGALYERAMTLQLRGGDRPASRGFQALEVAIGSDWSPPTRHRRSRHVISIWTDRPPTPDADFDRLAMRWEEMDQVSKRLLLFVPESPGWESVGNQFDNTVWFPVSEGQGLTDREQQEMLNLVVSSV
jgi:TIR domain